MPQPLSSGPSLADIVIQQLHDEVLGLFGDVAPDLRGEVRRVAAADGFGPVAVGEVAREHNVDHDAATPQVSCPQTLDVAVRLLHEGIPPPDQHLRGHVWLAAVDMGPVSVVLDVPGGKRAVHALAEALVHATGDRGTPRPGKPHARGDAEVSELQHRACGILRLEEEVFRLDIAMHNTHGMAVREGVEHLLCEVPSELLWKMAVWRFGDEAVEVATLAQLHDQQDGLSVFVRLVKPHDVRVVEFAHHLDLSVQRGGVVVALVEQLARIKSLAFFVLDNPNCSMTPFTEHELHFVRLFQLPVPGLHADMLRRPPEGRVGVELQHVGRLKGGRGQRGAGRDCGCELRGLGHCVGDVECARSTME
mmetsp:Transcript_52458/g.170354  ORF Transcript_52458/g.170354 Transcript_52458/m.170354 type:complete len:363 (+) Transcript_52458:1460-2548(+)